MPKIKSVRATEFKRFADLTITDIPESARLVVLLGPNGCGKSSLLEAFNHYYYGPGKPPMHDRRNYLAKNGLPVVDVQFHGTNLQTEAQRKRFYFRTSYRNEPSFHVTTISPSADPIHDEMKPNSLVDADVRVSRNYSSLVANAVSILFGPDRPGLTQIQLRDLAIDKVRNSVKNVFGPDLEFRGLGDIRQDGTFVFSKGSALNYHYVNLSGGEKAAFDLILDLVIKTSVFDDTVFCIDEPESHIHSGLQASLLQELYALIPAQRCQLWIATNSMGMLKKALDLQREDPSKIVFLDFYDYDFDKSVTMRPAAVDRPLWKKAFTVALHDLAELVAPEVLVICEGRPLGTGKPNSAEFDSKIYRIIFSRTHPNADFASAGGCDQNENDMLKLAVTYKSKTPGVKVIQLLDRDNKSPDEIRERRESGVKVLSRYSIENYLWSDEILNKLFAERHCQTEASRILALKRDPSLPENPLEPIRSKLHVVHAEIKKLSQFYGTGSDIQAFAKHVLAGIVTENTVAYRELERDIFN